MDWTEPDARDGRLLPCGDPSRPGAEASPARPHAVSPAPTLITLGGRVLTPIISTLPPRVQARGGSANVGPHTRREGSAAENWGLAMSPSPSNTPRMRDRGTAPRL